MDTSGMAKSVFSEATRVLAAMNSPAPAPMTMPSAMATTGTRARASKTSWCTLYSRWSSSTCAFEIQRNHPL